MAARRINRTIDLSSGTVTFDVIATGQALVASASELSDEIKLRLMLQGINAVVGDSASDPNVDALSLMEARWGKLKEGQWTVRSTGTGTPRVTMFAEAVAIAAKVSVEDAIEKLATMSDEERKELRGHSGVKLAMQEIRAKRAAEEAKKAKKAAKDDEGDLSAFGF